MGLLTQIQLDIINKDIESGLIMIITTEEYKHLQAENEKLFNKVNRLKTAIGDSISQMDEEPAKELLKQALKD